MVVNNKLLEILQRNLFGCLLAISLTENTHIQILLAYPITPVPFTMCQMDGTICKTNKSVPVEYFTINTVPSYGDPEIIDRFYILHCIIDVLKKFGNNFCGN